MPIYAKIQSNEYDFGNLKASLFVMANDFYPYGSEVFSLSTGHAFYGKHMIKCFWNLKYQVCNKKHEDQTIFCNNLNVFLTIKLSDIAANIISWSKDFGVSKMKSLLILLRFNSWGSIVNYLGHCSNMSKTDPYGLIKTASKL